VSQFQYTRPDRLISEGVSTALQRRPLVDPITPLMMETPVSGGVS